MNTNKSREKKENRVVLETVKYILNKESSVK